MILYPFYAMNILVATKPGTHAMSRFIMTLNCISMIKHARATNKMSEEEQVSREFISSKLQNARREGSLFQEK